YFFADHALRPKDPALRLILGFSVSCVYQTPQPALKDLDDAGGQRSSAVEPLVNNDCFFAELREEITGKIGVAAKPSVWHVNVGNASLRHLVHFATVVLDPGQVA